MIADLIELLDGASRGMTEKVSSQKILYIVPTSQQRVSATLQINSQIINNIFTRGYSHYTCILS